jgi:hypothetical protein
VLVHGPVGHPFEVMDRRAFNGMLTWASGPDQERAAEPM